MSIDVVAIRTMVNMSKAGKHLNPVTLAHKDQQFNGTHLETLAGLIKKGHVSVKINKLLDLYRTITV